MKQRIDVAASLLVLLLAALPAAAADWETCWGHYEAGRWSDAVPCFEELNAEYDGWAWGQFYLGVSYMESGQDRKALSAFDKAMEWMPDDEQPGWEPFFNSAAVLLKLGEYRKGLDNLGRGQAFLQPQNAAAADNLKGKLYAGLGDWGEAVRYLEKSGMDDFETVKTIGIAQFRAGDFTSAAEMLEKALNMQPTDQNTVELLLNIFQKRAANAPDPGTKKRLWAKVASIADRLLRLDPSSLQALVIKGQAEMGAGNYDAARSLYDRILKRDPNNCIAVYNMAQLEAQRERWSAAARLAGQAANCLTQPDAKRNAYQIQGDSELRAAKQAVEGLADDDAEGRRRAIAQLENAKDHYERAARIRRSEGLTGKMTGLDETIAGLREAIETIEENQRIDAENKRIEEENRRREEMAREIEKATGGSN